MDRRDSGGYCDFGVKEVLTLGENRGRKYYLYINLQNNYLDLDVDLEYLLLEVMVGAVVVVGVGVDLDYYLDFLVDCDSFDFINY